MPKVGIHRGAMFHFLGRASDIDRGRDQRLIAVPKKEHFHAVVFMPLDADEVLAISAAIHLSPAIAVDDAAVVGDDGVAQSPADLPRCSGIPSGFGDVG